MMQEALQHEDPRISKHPSTRTEKERKEMLREEEFNRPYLPMRPLLWIIALAFFVFQGVMPAQEVTASVLGTVSDPSGAPVAGAKVSATDVDRGTAFSTM